ncbi:MAG: hypothetical protein K2Q18_07585, partial [Bdellovibrionales bacterium]|nr:hypothetical protein [Bdellovibrionales bacterium]
MKNAFLAVTLIFPLLSSCGLDKEVAKIEKKAILINKYENVALKLAKENRELHAEVKRLEFEIQKIKQATGFKSEKSSGGHGEEGAGAELAHGESKPTAHGEVVA